MELVLVLFFRMEFRGKYSMELHALILHRIPWKASSMENTLWNSMEIHVLILHGIPWKYFTRVAWVFVASLTTL